MCKTESQLNTRKTKACQINVWWQNKLWAGLIGSSRTKRTFTRINMAVEKKNPSGDGLQDHCIKTYLMLFLSQRICEVLGRRHHKCLCSCQKWAVFGDGASRVFFICGLKNGDVTKWLLYRIMTADTGPNGCSVFNLYEGDGLACQAYRCAVTACLFCCSSLMPSRHTSFQMDVCIGLNCKATITWVEKYIRGCSGLCVRETSVAHTGCFRMGKMARKCCLGKPNVFFFQR